MPASEGDTLTAYIDSLTFWAEHSNFGGMPSALCNFAALHAAEWIPKETGIIC